MTPPSRNRQVLIWFLIYAVVTGVIAPIVFIAYMKGHS